MTVDFRTLLNKPAGDIKRPPTWPAGTYFGRTGQYKLVESDKKKTPGAEFPITFTSATDAIDPSQLEGIDLTKKQMRQTFWLTPDSEFRVVEFAESCGIDKNGRSLGELIAECSNKEVLIELIVKPSQQNPEETYNEIKSIKGVANT